MRRGLAWALLAPALLFIALLFVAPVAALLAGAFQGPAGWGLQPLVAFFDEPLHRDVYWRTLRIAGLATAVSALACYPAALAMVKMQGGVFGSVATSDALLAALGDGTDAP